MENSLEERIYKVLSEMRSNISLLDENRKYARDMIGALTKRMEFLEQQWRSLTMPSIVKEHTNTYE